MTECSGCSSPHPPDREKTIVGIQYLDDAPALILHDCPRCHSTQAIPWRRASALLVARAMRKEMEEAG